MRWTFHYQRPEKDSKTVLSKTMLKSSRWTKKYLKSKRWSTSIIKMWKKLTKIWRRKTLSQVRNKSMRSFTKKRRKSMSLPNSSSKKRFNMKRKSKKINTLLLNFWSICRSQWQGKINFQPKTRSMIWEQIWNSNRVNLKTPKIQPLGSEFKKSKSKMI